MVPSEGSPGSSLDLSSDSDVPPTGIDVNASSQTVPVQGKVTVSHTSTTDNSRGSSASPALPQASPAECAGGVETKESPINTVVSHNGLLKRKREGSEDPTVTGELPQSEGNPDMERSQKRTQRSPDPHRDALLQNGSHPAEEKEAVANLNGPNETRGPPHLSQEIWQHTFSFVPPVFLGRLLRVNRAFNKILTPTDSGETLPSTKGALPYRDAESIWSASWKRFCPGLPKPLSGLTNLQMWRLLRGNSCQICGTKKPLFTTHASPDPWQSGPGPDGVRVFWAFGIRSCGPCMRVASDKEVSVLYQSTFPAFLLPALSCAFISQSDHLAASNELRTRSPPADLILTKVFYRPQMDEMKVRFTRVILDHGNAAVDEWVKGLDDEGRSRGEEVIRWENWEAKGGLEKVNMPQPKRKPVPVKKPIPKAVVLPTDAPATKTVPVTQTQTHRPLALPPKPAAAENFSPNQPALGKVLNWRPLEPPSIIVPEPLPQRPAPYVHNRFERSMHDVTEAKAARRAEIERRCMLIDPPLKANVLQHMDAFQAAVQIPSYLTETAWEVLKPRLLAQRDAAENRENERIHQEMILQVQTEELRQQEDCEKDSKDSFEKEWEAAQAPIRLRLGAYADQMIKQSWAGGASISKENCPKFAVDVLLWARERFFDDQQKQDETLRAAGGEVIPDEPDAPPTRRLILENMKWLYENKIRPYTDDFQRDLFLCSSCDGKFYGFEGVIQHYAAKHTSSMSLGNVVVHWRADWPDQPPFNSDPLTAIASQQAAPTPVPGLQSHSNGADQTNQTPYGLQDQNAIAVVQNILPNYQNSQYPSTGYPMQYQVQPTQASFPQQGTPYQGQVASGQGQSSMYNAGPSDQTPLATNLAYGGTYPYGVGHNYSLPSYTAPNGQTLYPTNSQGTTLATSYTPYSTTITAQYQATSLPPTSASRSIATPENTASAPAQAADLYNKQMDEMAVHAREVWFTTSGIKDIPHSVRIYIVIQQVSARFAKKYTNEPSLSMFLDGLNRVAAMRPVRSVNGLICAACANDGGDAEAPVDPQAQNIPSGKKTFTLPLILNHFRSAHLEKAAQQTCQVRKPDWRYEMIQLPDPTTISNVVYAQGMDNKKLQLLSEVFPGLFPAQLPKAAEQYYPSLKSDNGQDGPLSVLQKIKTNQAAQSIITYNNLPGIHSYGNGYGENLPDSRTYSPVTARASEPPGEDEYDPHRPEFLGRMVTPNPTAILARKATAPENETASKPPIGYAPIPSPSKSNSLTYPDPSEQPYLRGTHVQDMKNQPNGHSGAYLGYSVNQVNQSATGNTNGGSQHANQSNSVSAHSPPDMQRIEHAKHAVNGSLNQSGYNSEHQTPSSKTFVGSEAEKFLKDFEVNNSIRRPMPASTNDRFGTPSREEPLRLYTRRRSPSMEPPAQTAYEMSQRGGPNMPYQTAVYHEQWSRQNSQPRGTPIPVNYPAPEARYYAPREQAPMGEVRRAYEGDPRNQYQQFDVQHANATLHASNERLVQPPMPRYYDAEQPLPVQYRERSRSPRVVTLPPGHYRQRSPIEAARPEYYYQVPVAARAASRERQPIYYKYPSAQEEYTYVRSRQASDAPARRVEYIPVREDEYALAQQQGRYVIAQPAAEVGGTSEHVRYVRYSQEQMYEQPEAATYYADQAVYEPRQARAVYQPIEGVGIPTQRPRY